MLGCPAGLYTRSDQRLAIRATTLSVRELASRTPVPYGCTRPRRDRQTAHARAVPSAAGQDRPRERGRTASKKTLNLDNLEALGARRLAELLLELAAGDAAAKRRLRLELS